MTERDALRTKVAIARQIVNSLRSNVERLQSIAARREASHLSLDADSAAALAVYEQLLAATLPVLIEHDSALAAASRVWLSQVSLVDCRSGDVVCAASLDDVRRATGTRHDYGNIHHNGRAVFLARIERDERSGAECAIGLEASEIDHLYREGWFTPE